MLIFSILVFSILGVSIALLLKPIRPELSLLTLLATGVLILLALLGKLSGIFDSIRELTVSYGIESSSFSALLKILAIAYLAQFGAELCRDAGAGAVAAKVELGGRILILASVLPVAVSALETAAALLREAVQ